MWSSGQAFIFNYSKFFGVDINPSPVTFNPAAFSGTGYSIDPYFLFDTDLRVGMEVGASINGGSIDANLDYQVSFAAPDIIRSGEAFSLTGSAAMQSTSGFQSSPANASAYVDGILDFYFGGYARFVTGGLGLGVHDYRMGKKGFTDDPASNSNTPYRTLANINYTPEIIGINRNESGQLHVLGVNQGGTGSEYTFGSTTITAGNWNVSTTGALVGQTVQGTGEETLVSAEIDIDQMATQGVPVLGTGFAHDWGAIDIDIGYEIVDVRSTLSMGLRQDFSIDSKVIVKLLFSDIVLIEGVGETNSYLGPLSSIPNITLLTDSVTVNPQFIVSAQLTNDTDLTFNGGLGVTFIEGHIFAGWKAGIFGSGTAANLSIGPFYENDESFPLFDIDVFSDQFELSGFDAIIGESFVLEAILSGDFNDDGRVDLDDVNPFLLALTNPTQYAIDYPQVDRIAVGDINQNGKFDLGDVAAFKGLVPSAFSAQEGVPEPSTGLLLLLGLNAWLIQRRNPNGLPQTELEFFPS